MIAAVALAAALATPFGELPITSAGGPARCLTATGAPGELARWVAGGMELLAARPTGLAATGGVPLGRLTACPGVAGDASGALVIAGPVRGGVRVALREPGGTWDAPVTLTGTPFDVVQAAISARGDVVLAWIERARIMAVTRPAGGSFGAVRNLGKYSDSDEGPPGVSVGMSGAGAPLAVTSLPDNDGMRIAFRTAGGAGAPFGPARALAGTQTGADDGRAVTAVAPDGRALVAVGGFNDLSIYERAPGAQDFAPPQHVFDGALTYLPALALRPDGAAALAWTTGTGDPVYAVIRGGPGAFGAAQRLTDPIPPRKGIDHFNLYGFEPGSVPIQPQVKTALALGADGRALAALPTYDNGVQVVSVPGGGQLVGSPLRDAAALTPLVLADGTRAIAWSDDRGIFDDTGKADGRLHLAIEGASQTQPPAPAVTVQPPRTHALRPGQTLVLRGNCQAACDVRAFVPGDPPDSDLTRTLARAGAFTLRFQPRFQALIPAHGPLRVTVHSGAPGAHAYRTQVLTLHLKRLPMPRLPLITHVSVHRHGDALDVRWRTDGPALDAAFGVVGLRDRSVRHQPLAVARLDGKGRRRFHVTLHHAARVRFVRISEGAFVGGANHLKTVRLPG